MSISGSESQNETLIDHFVGENASTSFVASDFIPHRVFMNHVDSFNAKHIAAFLADQFYGYVKPVEITVEEAPDEEQLPEELPTSPVKIIERNKFEIIGTLRQNYHRRTEDIFFTINEKDETYISEILKCGTVIFDITQEANEIPKALHALKAIKAHLKKIKKIGPKTYENYNDHRVFILLSTAMTWAMTKPLSRRDPDFVFSEIDYRKRRAHPNYNKHIDCERKVIPKGAKFSDKLKTYVVCCGITYGHEEEDLEVLFKLAWNNEKYLPIFYPGNNYIPLIHIDDLAKVLNQLIDKPPTKPQFILAVEQIPTTLRQLIKALSKTLGRGLVQDVPVEEAFLYKDIKQKNFERCTVNLKMEPVFISENLQIEWKNDLNISKNMTNIVAEFRAARNLIPLKIIIHGPPSSGKSRLAKNLCEHYGAHYITVKTMIEETLEEMREMILAEKARLKAKEQTTNETTDYEELDEMVEEEEEESVDLEELEEQIRDIVVTMSKNENGRLPDEYVIKLMRTFLGKNLCQNKGYVIDGFPKNTQQAKELFGQASESGAEEEVAEGALDGNASNKIMPDYVISLQATDEFLCSRLMQLPERDVQGTRYSETIILQKLKEFRVNNTEDNTVLNFFDEIEIHPILIDVTTDDTENMEGIAAFVSNIFGNPVGFGITVDEEKELQAIENEARKLQEKANEIEKKKLQDKATKEYQDKMEKWTETLEKLQMEEEKILTAHSEPLRNYLMHYVFPVLTKGLMEVVQVKPDDPVDFLAEYLFKENPEGKMFDPSYTRSGEKLLAQYEAQIQSAIDSSNLSD